MLYYRAIVVVICILTTCMAAKLSPKHKVAKRWAYIENGDPQMRTIRTDCKQIVREYSEGELPFYEYTAKMKKCMDRQQRTNIPSYEDSDFFTPSFNVPGTQSTKRFETPGNLQQSEQQANNQYANYDYNGNNYQNSYGMVDQRADIASPHAPSQYQAPQTQSYATPNYYQNQPLTVRNDIPSSQAAPNTMYSNDIVKKDEIPRPAYY